MCTNVLVPAGMGVNRKSRARLVMKRGFAEKSKERKQKQRGGVGRTGGGGRDAI